MGSKLKSWFAEGELVLDADLPGGEQSELQGVAAMHVRLLCGGCETDGSQHPNDGVIRWTDKFFETIGELL